MMHGQILFYICVGICRLTLIIVLGCRDGVHTVSTRVNVLFQVFIQPIIEPTLPQNAILRFQHPVVLVGEIQEFGVDAAQDGCVVGLHALREADAVVQAAVDDEDGRGPFVHKEVGRVGVGLAHGGVVPVPEGATEVPIHKPHLLGFEVLCLQVEHAVVGDEGLEAAVVVTGQPVHAEAAEAGTHGAEAVLVDVRLFLQLVDGAEVVLHALSAVVAADFLKPFLTEAGQAATVGGDDDVVVGGHHLEVPAVAPELAHSALRSAFAVEQGRVLLGAVEMRGIDDPGQHVLAVGGLHPAFLDLTHGELGEDVVVDGGDLRCLARGGVDAEELRRGAPRLAACNQFVAVELYRYVVVQSIRSCCRQTS